jgi:hypothetical protein
MKTTKLFAGIATVMVLSFTACKKEAVTPPPTPTPEPTKEELIGGKTVKTWIITKVESDGKDMSGQVPACSKDNEYVFRADKSYQFLAGPEKCSMENDVLTEGTWKLSDDDNKLIYTDKSGTSEDDILELSATTMKTRLMSGNMEVIFTYTAQ